MLRAQSSNSYSDLSLQVMNPKSSLQSLSQLPSARTSPATLCFTPPGIRGKSFTPPTGQTVKLCPVLNLLSECLAKPPPLLLRQKQARAPCSCLLERWLNSLKIILCSGNLISVSNTHKMLRKQNCVS